MSFHSHPTALAKKKNGVKISNGEGFIMWMLDEHKEEVM